MENNKKSKFSSEKALAILSAIILLAECGKNVVKLFDKKGGEKK